MEAELSLKQVHWAIFDVPLVAASSSRSSSVSSTSSPSAWTDPQVVGELNGDHVVRYYVKFHALEDCYCLLVSDLVHVWRHTAERADAKAEHKVHTHSLARSVARCIAFSWQRRL
jgi:XLF N-terminal domain